MPVIKRISELATVRLSEIEAVHGSGPVDLWHNARLRKESRMSGETDAFDGLLH